MGKEQLVRLTAIILCGCSSSHSAALFKDAPEAGAGDVLQEKTLETGTLDAAPDVAPSDDLIGRPCVLDLECFKELPQGFCRLGVCSRLCEHEEDCCVPGEVCGVCAPAPASGPTARACMRVCERDADCWAGDGCIEGRCTDGQDT